MFPTNMCKLIEDPKEIYPLMPILKPLVVNCAENISNPEARSIAERSLNTLNKACGEGFKLTKYSLEDIQIVLKSQINVNDVNLTEKIDNLSEIILELSNIQYFEYNVWFSFRR